jgi:benzylsuccinate CoA-transferase BbsF subunit
MKRLGLGYEALRTIRPELVMLSASGLGRTGRDAERVAYGNLLSAYSGFSTLNGFPGGEPRTGLAWADPLCGLLIAFGVAAALHRRDRGGGGRHIDFSMLEALLWTMPGALLAEQRGDAVREPSGNDDPVHTPHGVYRCAGDDRWLAIAVAADEQWHALCAAVPALAALGALSAAERRARRGTIDGALREWARDRDAIAAMDELQAAGVPASAAYGSADLFADAHLWERRFYRTVVERDGSERWLPALPWRWGDDAAITPRAAPALGEHSEFVLRTLAGLSDEEIARLRAAGAFGGTAVKPDGR